MNFTCHMCERLFWILLFTTFSACHTFYSPYITVAVEHDHFEDKLLPIIITPGVALRDRIVYSFHSHDSFTSRNHPKLSSSFSFVY